MADAPAGGAAADANAQGDGNNGGFLNGMFGMAVKFIFVHFCIRHLTGQFLNPNGTKNVSEVGSAPVDHLQSGAAASNGKELAGSSKSELSKQEVDKIFNSPERVFMNALRPGERFDMYVHVTNRPGLDWNVVRREAANKPDENKKAALSSSKAPSNSTEVAVVEDSSVVRELLTVKNMNYTTTFDAVSKNVTMPANWFLESNELQLQDWKIVMTVVPSRLANVTSAVDDIFQFNATVPLIHTMEPLIDKTVSLLGDSEEEQESRRKN